MRTEAPSFFQTETKPGVRLIFLWYFSSPNFSFLSWCLFIFFKSYTDSGLGPKNKRNLRDGIHHTVRLFTFFFSKNCKDFTTANSRKGKKSKPWITSDNKTHTKGRIFCEPGMEWSRVRFKDWVHIQFLSLSSVSSRLSRVSSSLTSPS